VGKLRSSLSGDGSLDWRSKVAAAEREEKTGCACVVVYAVASGILSDISGANSGGE